MAAFSHVRVVIMPAKLWITVKPQSKKSEVKKISDGEYAVSVNAPAREGKANEAVIEALADYFSVPKSSIRIIRGQTGRRKLIALP
jgi:uncharacterized protein (TIGR00251 family)